MRRSDAMRMIEAQGFDPLNISAMVLRPDEFEFREKSTSDGVNAVWYLSSDDIPGLEETFLATLHLLNYKAPVPLGDVTAIRADWRGVTVSVSNGLQWQIPYEAEPEYTK